MANNNRHPIANLPSLRGAGMIKPVAPQMIMYPFQEQTEAPPGTDHFHWGITAFHHADENNSLFDVVQVEVEANCEENAIARAMAIVQRPYYRVQYVKEACSIDPIIANNKKE